MASSLFANFDPQITNVPMYTDFKMGIGSLKICAICGRSFRLSAKIGQLAAEKIEGDVGVEQARHCHSPRTRCCHANGSSGNRTVPANLAKSVGALFSCSPFTRASRN